MPWSIPIPLLSTRLIFQTAFTGTQTLLNLWDYFGQPDSASDVIVTFSGQVNALSLGNWPVGSVINITGLAGTQFRGRGGGGGLGATSFFEPLIPACVFQAASAGNNGFGAILTPNNGCIINYDGDDCFAWGGGGGGGGGGYRISGSCDAGGGGGAGQSWTPVGGAPGTPLVSNDGGTGNEFGPGAGGTIIFGSGGAGGAGGAWGTVGVAGSPGTDFGQGAGGLGGRAIQTSTLSSSTDTVNIVGTKNQATLISEGRLIGRNGDPIGPRF